MPFDAGRVFAAGTLLYIAPNVMGVLFFAFLAWCVSLESLSLGCVVVVQESPVSIGRHFFHLGSGVAYLPSFIRAEVRFGVGVAV